MKACQLHHTVSVLYIIHFNTFITTPYQETRCY